MMHYIRAFFQALTMTLRGETIQSPAQQQFPQLFEWKQATEKQLQAVFNTAMENGYDVDERKRITFRVDGRDVSMETVLNTVEFHLSEEYPFLLENLTDHSLTALYATNMNDQYAVSSLAQQQDLNLNVANAIGTLSESLKNIPQTK